MALLVEAGVPNARPVAIGERLTIGRDQGCAIRIDDPLVAGRHAEVVQADGAYQLVDLGSRRGTFVGDRRVSTHTLRHGDEILVGPTRLRFENPEATAAGDLRARLRRKADRAGHAAVELSNSLERAADLPAMLEALLATALELVPADRGAVLLGDEHAPAKLRVARNRDGSPAEITLSTSLLSEVVARGTGVVVPNVLDLPHLSASSSLVAQRIRSAICVPIAHRGEQLGVMHLDSPMGNAFDDGQLELVTSMARQASVAIRSALLAAKVDSAATAERERLHGLLANLPDGVLLVERDGRIAFANPLALELLAALGSPPREGLLERVGGHGPGELLGTRGPVEIVTARQPRRIIVSTAREVSGDAAGSTLLVLRDVTAEREREARAAQHERLALLGQLAAGVAHDFNNVLVVIDNFTRFVLDDAKEERHREDLREVLGAAGRAAQLVKQLLAFGRREMMNPQVVRLDRAMAGMERLLRGALGERIDLRTSVPEDLWRVKVDPVMLGQVVLNLVVNARDAMPDGGTIGIRGHNRTLDVEDARNESLPPGRYVVLETTDTGVGMPEQVASRVFEPFFTTKGPGKGSGLGLATAYGIVRQAGGTITLRTAPGAGTTFSVHLPATDEADAPAAVARASFPGSGETILVAEDETVVRTLTRRILAEAGYRVLEAGDGAEALELAAHHPGPVDLLLTDMVMPGMTGKQLAERLAAQRAGLTTLFMSGYFDEGFGSEIHQHFLAKPFQREALLERVHQALATRH
jgi:signal transduction histidine kinase/CheY-like chemotaxis protein